MKFHLLIFHKHFDCLLCPENLNLLKANVDLSKNSLITPLLEKTLKFHNIEPVSNIEVQPRSEQVFQIKMNNAKSGYAITSYKSKVVLDISKAMNVENYNDSYFFEDTRNILVTIT